MCTGKASGIYEDQMVRWQSSRAQRVDYKTRELLRTQKMPSVSPTVSDDAIQSAGAAQALRARSGRGRRSTLLTAGSLGDTSTLLGSR